MSNKCTPYFDRVDLVVIPSYIELPWINLEKILKEQYAYFTIPSMLV